MKFLSVLALCAAATGCATRLDIGAVRREVVRQSGGEPRDTFELAVGRMTLHALRTLAGTEPGLLTGVSGAELAVYELPESGAVDFTRMEIRGWESAVAVRKDARSARVLMRGSGDHPREIVLLGADENGAIFVRVTGRLPGDLPGKLARLFEDRGVNGLRLTLTEEAGK